MVSDRGARRVRVARVMVIVLVAGANVVAAEVSRKPTVFVGRCEGAGERLLLVGCERRARHCHVKQIALRDVRILGAQ